MVNDSTFKKYQCIFSATEFLQGIREISLSEGLVLEFASICCQDVDFRRK